MQRDADEVAGITLPVISEGPSHPTPLCAVAGSHGGSIRQRKPRYIEGKGTAMARMGSPPHHIQMIKSQPPVPLNALTVFKVVIESKRSQEDGP